MVQSLYDLQESCDNYYLYLIKLTNANEFSFYYILTSELCAYLTHVDLRSEYTNK